MTSNRLFQIVKLGLKSLLLHKLRSGLTMLGIVFGVCSVIAMLSIGEGASYEAQQQIREMGANNILVRSVKPPEDQTSSAQNTRVINYGLTYADASRLEETIPTVEVIVRTRENQKDIRYADRRSTARVLGTVPWYPEIANHEVAEGRFFGPIDIRNMTNVCVLGSTVSDHLFPFENPLGKIVRVGSEYFRIIGVMEPKSSSGDTGDAEAGVAADYIFVPISTARTWFGEYNTKQSAGSRETELVELHELQVRVDDINRVEATAAVVRSTLDQFHKKKDVEVIVPLELLAQARETQRIFSIVLGSIAGISLLVGGIGIMNIMLATVTERTREIGIRRALGARRSHVVTQFVVETMVLSVSGGLLGIALGLIVPWLVTEFADMKTIVTPPTLILAFGISATVGIVFGLYPAWRAANMDPIEALRHE